MTVTDELRRLLDERGVEWKSANFIEPNVETQWSNNRYSDYTGLPPFLTISNCTPEQAIAATLGSGTCEYAINDNMNETEGMGDVWIECSACHFTFDYHGGKWLMNMNYCPYCGARMERRER